MKKHDRGDALRPYSESYAELDVHESNSELVPGESGTKCEITIEDITLERREIVIDSHNVLVIYLNK